MKMLGTVVIGGGTGFIGQALSRQLQARGYDILIVSRKPGPYRITWSDFSRQNLPKNTAAVVSLAGQNFLDITRRWTPGFQQNVIASRVNTTQTLARAIINSDTKPKCFLTISGVGYYPPSETAEYDESKTPEPTDFLSRLTRDWEAAATLPKELNVRQATIRSGVVLGRKGGMISQLFWPFYFGLGGPIGSGKQFMPWIHVEDIAGIFVYAIENENVSGALNGVAPQIINNTEFAKAFGSALRRPALIPLPAFVVNIMFGPERAKVMTEGQKVIPKRTLQLGYKYKYPDIISACMTCTNVIYIDT